MKLSFKSIFFSTLLMLMGHMAFAQSNCSAADTNGEKSAKSCESKVATTGESTSGCSPTSCRGAKTKFGEAKVISTLRLDLIDLKAGMEQSAVHAFDAQSYDIHGIIGETDEESLDIIIKEVKVVEKEIAEKLNKRLAEFQLPENKAKQIQYLSNRIKGLKALL
ncbi:hypothetical protein [Flagellimonas flava]|uniref:hypothetical protein n=1 Tax=Flagellimonas flava TaxID=570519 RepID=UPI003D65085E